MSPPTAGLRHQCPDLIREQDLDIWMCAYVPPSPICPLTFIPKGTALVQTSQLVWPCCSPLPTPCFHRDPFQATLPTGELAHTHVDISQALAPRGFQGGLVHREPSRRCKGEEGHWGVWFPHFNLAELRLVFPKPRSQLLTGSSPTSPNLTVPSSSPRGRCPALTVDR